MFELNNLPVEVRLSERLGALEVFGWDGAQVLSTFVILTQAISWPEYRRCVTDPTIT